MKGTLFDRKNTSKVLKQQQKILVRPSRKKLNDNYITMFSFLLVLGHPVNE